MVQAFGLLVNRDEHDPTDVEWDEIDEGLDLFRKHFFNLWT